MGQETNDLNQLIEVKKVLANVYKSQVIAESLSHERLSLLHEAIGNVTTLIKVLKSTIE